MGSEMCIRDRTVSQVNDISNQAFSALPVQVQDAANQANASVLKQAAELPDEMSYGGDIVQAKINIEHWQ